MTEALLIAIGLALGAVATLAVVVSERRRRQARNPVAPPSGRILFPFVGDELSQSALDVAIRLSHREGATLVPVYLASVPMPLALDAPLPRTCEVAFTIFEAIEQRAAHLGVHVDSRIVSGRNARHALRLLSDQERYDRIVVPAAADGTDGFSADDVAWMLRNAPGEMLVIRTIPADGRRREPQDLSGHGGRRRKDVPDVAGGTRGRR